MLNTNLEIRQAVKENGLKLWQIAEKLKINDGNLSRKLRKELPEDKKAKILEIIREMKQVDMCGNSSPKGVNNGN